MGQPLNVGPLGEEGREAPVFTYMGRETPCWRKELWAVGSVARVLCWASRTSSARSQRIWEGVLDSCVLWPPPQNPSFPGCGPVTELPVMVLSHFPAED